MRGNDGGITLTWEAPFSNFVSEASTTLPANWTTVTNAPAFTAGHWVVPQMLSNEAQFYRLKLR